VKSLAHPFLDLAHMEVLRKVRLRPRGAAEGSFAGPHKSHYRGTAVEFADYREYVHGDDIRLLDWKVLARTDRYYVRLYEAERNLLSYLVLDTSGSMEFEGAAVKTESKLARACRLAAALAYLVVREGDEVGMSVVGERLGEHVRPRTGFRHLGTVLETLSGATAGGGTDLGACLEEVYGRLSRRGVLVVISDFLTPAARLWKSVDLFRKSMFDVMLFHVAHPEELELPDVPAARFVETEGAGHFVAEPDVLREIYRRRMAAFLSEVKAAAVTRGCDWYLARTDVDPYVFLERCFLERTGQGRTEGRG
jgi:uncharacterized protein (DUF58 family)